MKHICKKIQILLPSYVNEDISLPEKEKINQHLTFCVICQNKLTEISQTLSTLKFAEKKSDFTDFSNQKILNNLHNKEKPNYKIALIPTFITAFAFMLFFLFFPVQQKNTELLSLTESYDMLINFAYQNQDKIWQTYIDDSEDNQYKIYESLYYYLSENLGTVDDKTVDQYYIVLTKNINYFI